MRAHRSYHVPADRARLDGLLANFIADGGLFDEPDAPAPAGPADTATATATADATADATAHAAHAARRAPKHAEVR